MTSQGRLAELPRKLARHFLRKSAEFQFRTMIERSKAAFSLRPHLIAKAPIAPEESSCQSPQFLLLFRLQVGHNF